ncbi:MAG: hypothetical protein HRT44_06315 [Bdellovibrionales bacterium]|nr:hypothetical protein [Bdellovibrionales bacterium]NQZ18856.1 hypothetical protein [Bdellovibrionales bacterium]
MPFKVDSAFRKLIVDSGLPLRTFAKATDSSPLDILKWWSKEEFTFLSDKQIQSFESYFAISANDILDSNYNLKLLRERIFNHPLKLPEKYEKDAGSFVRSSFYILKYLRLLFGQKFVDDLLIDMEMHPSYMDDLDNTINIRFINDLLIRCKKMGFSKDEFTNLANSLFMSIENTSSEFLFNNISGYEDFYHALSKLPTKFDVNFNYEFNIGISGAEVIATPTEIMEEVLEDKRVNTKTLFNYRPMLFSQAPMVAKLRPAKISVDSCLSRGDRFSRYKIDFTQSSFRLV